jgi:hypothetical protein
VKADHHMSTLVLDRACLLASGTSYTEVSDAMAKRNSEIQVVGNRLGRVGEGLGRRFVDIIDACIKSSRTRLFSVESDSHHHLGGVLLHAR